MFTVRRTGKRAIMIQPSSILRRLARQGGMGKTMPIGFHLSSKANTQVCVCLMIYNYFVYFKVWPYPCARPLFETCWRYLTQNANSCHAVALQLRILYSCIRWSDMTPDDKVSIFVRLLKSIIFCNYSKRFE